MLPVSRLTGKNCPFFTATDALHGASLCSVTYCVSRGLALNGSPETGSALMNDGKTLLALKYFPIVLTRNGWNVFATKSHSWEFEALELSKIGRYEREKEREGSCARELLQLRLCKNSLAKILSLKQWKIQIRRNEYIRPFLFHRMLRMSIANHAKPDRKCIIELLKLFKWNNKNVSNKEQVELTSSWFLWTFSFNCLIMYYISTCIYIFSFLLEHTITNAGTCYFWRVNFAAGLIAKLGAEA